MNLCIFSISRRPLDLPTPAKQFSQHPREINMAHKRVAKAIRTELRFGKKRPQKAILNREISRMNVRDGKFLKISYLDFT
jgi:hypothetical protein